MQPFTAELAQAALRPQAEEIFIGADAFRVELDSRGGRVIERSGEAETEYPIVHALGGKNVFYFLTPLDSGRLQVLPLAYDVRAREWFDTAGSGVRHFPDETQTEAWHWTDVVYTFNTSCYGCHVSQMSTNYDLATDSYETTWAEPGINCETCHGPASEHVRVFTEAAGEDPPPDLEIISTKPFTVEQTNDMCAICHAKMSPLTVTFQPGDRFFDHFDLVTLEDSDFYPDGRDLGENYTHTGWLGSPCVKSGQLDCLHCHTSSGRFRQTEDPNQACAPCHGQHVTNPPAHTHHEPDSAGSLCISCHMPSTSFARMRRHDHSMLPPAPAATIEFGSPNACNLCHEDQHAAWADGWVRRWRDRDYQAPVLRRASLVQAARQQNWSRLGEMLEYIREPDRDVVVANSLIRLLAAAETEEKWPVLVAAMDDSSPLIRASAASALQARLLDPEAAAALLRATRDDYRIVRVRAASSLSMLSPGALSQADRTSLGSALDEFEASLQSRPDDALSHYNLGNFRFNRGKLQEAAASYETAIRLRPDLLPPYVNLAQVYNALDEDARAEANLRKALEIDPDNTAANLNLGLLLGGQGRVREAQEALRAALTADPELAVAAYNLAVMLAETDLEESLELARRAASSRPSEPRYGYTHAFFLRQAGRASEAISVLEGVTDSHRGYPDAFLLLGQLYEDTGRLDDARRLYRRAIDLPELPDAAKYELAARLRVLDPGSR
jgi:tetratricopeptide (TPR) repeat protein